MTSTLLAGNTPAIAVVVTATHFRSDRSGGQMVWKYLVDHWKASGLKVVSEDEHPTPSSMIHQPLIHALWYLTAYGSMRRAVFVVDQGEGLRLGFLLRYLRFHRSNRLIVVVHHLREAFRYDNPLYVRLATWNETFVLRLAHRVVVHTQDTARDVANRGVDNGRIVVIPLGTRGRASHIPIRPLAPGEPLRLLWVGGDFARKGLFQLMAALERVPPPRPRVTVAGQPQLDGDLAAARAQALRHGVGDTMTFLGFVPPDQMERLWEEHDAYVLPSLREGHGLALDEALQRGVPALVSDLPVFLERIRPDEALIVPRGDSEALANCLVQLRDLDLRQRLSRDGRARAQAFPRWETTLQGYDRLIREEMNVLARTTDA